MVQVRRMNAPAKSGPKSGPTKEKQTITKADVATVPATSLTQSSDSKAIATAAKGAILPAFLKKDGNLPAIIPGAETGYVGFADNRNKIFGSLQACGIEEGDPYICRNNEYILCKPLKYYLLAGESFKSIMLGEAGEWVYCTRDIVSPTDQLWEKVHPALKAPSRVGSVTKEAVLPDLKFFKKNLQEHYVICMVVLTDDGDLIPTKGDFRGTKKGTAEGPIRAVEAASTPEWLNRSDANKVAGQFPHPFGRVLHSVSTFYGSGKASGYSFYVAKAVSRASTIDEMKQLLEAMADKDYMRDVEEAHINYTKRCDFLDQLIETSNVA